ncbi:tail fiber protein [Salmonella enterica]|nr:tail fiber protein [Salmonella enterica]EIS6418964.1 tail fiber protein [Salmonella enterica]
MGKLTELEQWDEDVYQIETSDPVLGGPEGLSNRPQKQLANRTQWLKKQLEDANSALAEHEKSRNHPDATLTDKGFVKLYSGVTSMDETMAATPKAVKIAMDNANARLAKERNLADLTNVPLARQSLQLGNSATLNVGTTPGTVAAGDDSRITGAMQKDQNGADIPDKPGFIKNVGLGETVDQAAGAMQKSQNGADITDDALFRRNIGVYDASTSQKGLVRLSGGVSDADDTLAATSGAVKIAYDAAQSAWRLAASKYTAEGATTGKAGLVQLVNSMGGSGSLVMPQAAVTTAIQSYPSLGKGQTLQDLRGSRSIDATYTNSTGFPIAVYVRISGGYSAVLYTYVNGIEFGGGGSTASNTSIATTFFIVPNGATYRVTATGASPALQMWSELR